MSASESLRAACESLADLWVISPVRAAAFVIAAAVVFLAFATSFDAQNLLVRIPIHSGTRDADRAAQALASAVRAREQIVLLVGGSTTRELTPADQYVSDTLSARCGRPLRFVNAGSSNQTLAESWAFAEYAARSRLVAVIVGMNYFRLEEDRPSLVTSLERMIAPVPRPSSLSLWLSYEGKRLVVPWAPLSDVARRLRALWRSLPEDSDARVLARLQRLIGTPYLTFASTPDPFLIERNAYREPVLRPEAKRTIANEYGASRTTLYRERVAAGREAWSAFAASVRAWGAVSLFVALPEDPSMARIRGAFGPAFDDAMASLVVSGNSYADLRTLHGLAPEHFYDQQHLVASGRRAFWPQFLAATLDVIPYCGASAAP